MFLEKGLGIFLETSVRFYKFSGAPIIASNSRPKISDGNWKQLWELP